MNIQSVFYSDKDNANVQVLLVNGEKFSVPVTAENRHWQKVQEWVTSGGMIDSYVAPTTPTNDEIYDGVIQNQQVLKALVRCINDGSIVPGANVSNAALKTAIKVKM